jgi:hypothetical protein
MKKTYYQNSLKLKILSFINQLPSNIVLRSDIEVLASPRQISRALKNLTKMGELVKLGSGVYAKAYWSSLLNKPIIKGGFGAACKEALTRLGVRWELGEAEKSYNTGKSTQVPVRTIVQLRSRFRRHLSYGDRQLIVENKVNAR